MMIVIIAIVGWETRQLGVDIADLDADIKLRDVYRENRNQVGLLKKAMHGLIHTGLLRSVGWDGDPHERIPALPGRPMRVQPGTSPESGRHHVVYVDNLLVAGTTKRDEM